MPSTGRVLLETLRASGVRYIFANLGSDHPAIIEAYAVARADGTEDRLPELVICPHESVAMAAALGYAQVTGVAQAVLVHVDCGTQNIGGMLHNAAKGRVPVLVLAGTSPATQDNELPGSRNEFIHWIQDVHDQRGIVRGYTKYDNEVRSGHNVAQLVRRALQIATSEPAGPVYLMAAREVLESEVPEQPAPPLPALAPTGLAPDTVAAVADALAGAERPLIVTSYLGRDPAAVPALVELAELLSVPVLESVPSRVNFPPEHPLHGGYQWNTGKQHELLAAADVVLVLHSDVPWIPAHNRPAAEARVFVLDADPLKAQMPLWHVPAELFAHADARTALTQLTAHLRDRATPDTARRDLLAAGHERRMRELTERERPDGDTITVPYLLACVRAAIDDDTLVLCEAISGYQAASEHLRRGRPGSLISSGGGSLGWFAGAAVGARLAGPARTVVSVVGDGTYLFAVPSAAYWVARKYGTPSLTVIIDNRGWRSPKLSTLGVHPDGIAARQDDFRVGFEPEADLPGIAAAAGGAWGHTVREAAALPAALDEALAVVRDGRCAVLSVHVPAT